MDYFKLIIKTILFVVIFGSTACSVKTPNQPNIIFIMSDDHAYQAISVYDSSLIQTLNIVQIAKQGILYNKAFVTNSICAPTLLDLAGVKIPDEMQGNSLRETWKTDSSNWRDAIYYHFYEKGWGVSAHCGIRTERYKLIHFYDEVDLWEFYDLKNDPSEMNNLIDNPEYSEIIENMKIRLAELQEKYKDNTVD